MKMYEKAEPVRTPQAESGREQNNKPRASPARRGNASGHVGPGKQACHRYQEDDDSSPNVYEEAEAVKLENISGDAPHGTDTSTDADTTQPDGARVKSRRVCYIAAALAVVGTLVIDVSYIPTTVNAFNQGHGQNQTRSTERPNEIKGAVPSFSTVRDDIGCTGSGLYWNSSASAPKRISSAMKETTCD
ncbi:hypothetical protein Bbelb_241570 [Branchiostoma belcheri]|nr:hypothetical protein Bbelb_241570 [Branchiostoma belcheri]